MNIVKIELLNFRNYRKKTFDKFTNLNIIIGCVMNVQKNIALRLGQ